MASEHQENMANENKESMTQSDPALVDATCSSTWTGHKTWSNPASWTRWKIPNKLKFFTEVKLNTALDISNIPSDPKELDKTLPIKEVNFGKLQNPPKDGMQILWIGHASVFVQFDGINILCDPVFSEYCGPSYPSPLAPLLKFFSCRRYRPVPCKIEDLKKNNVPIDVVLISHDHYDHLDQNSIEDLQKHFPSAKYVVPMGIGKWLKSCGCKDENVKEKKWWEEEKLIKDNGEWKFVQKDQEKEGGNVTFACTPAQHWCQRGIYDLNTRLWCSWAVLGPKKRFYFGGDTGYCDVFKTVGQKYGPFDLAALPIGAYEPKSYMHPQHVSPEEAVDIHVDIKSKNTLGIHWGTFKQLGCFEPYLDPPKVVKETLNDKKIKGCPENAFKTIHHGEIWTID